MSTQQNAVLALELMVCACVFATTAIAGEGSSSKATPSKYVGTYYTDAGAMLTIHSDGTLAHIVANMFSRDERRVTPALGVWRQIGKNEIKVTWVRFHTEQFGDNYSPNGLIQKLSYRMEFDKPVQGRSEGPDLVSTEGVT